MPSNEEMVGRWEYVSEESTWPGAGSYVEVRSDGTYEALLPDLSSEAIRRDVPSGEPEMVHEDGTWTRSKGSTGRGWFLELEPLYAFDIVGDSTDRRIVKDVGWVENPERFVLVKAD